MKKKRFIRISKRVMALLLCCSLVSGACFSKYKIETHAAALSLEASAEIMMFLWNLMINGMVVAGTADMVANYDDEKLTFEAFMDNLSDALGEPDMDDAYVVLDDGTKVGLDDYLDGYRDGTITIPDLEEWNLYRDRSEDEYDDPEDYILKNWDQEAMDKKWESIKGGGGGSAPQDPSEGPQFSKLQEFCISIGVIDVLVDTITDLYDGAIEGLEHFAAYGCDKSLLTGYVFATEYYDYVSAGNRIKYNTDVRVIFDKNEHLTDRNGRVAAYLNVYQGSNVYEADKYFYGFDFYRYEDASPVVYSCALGYLRINTYDNGRPTFVDDGSHSYLSINCTYPSSISYHFNFPVFTTKEAAENYCKNGDDSMAINKPKIDLGVILSVTPEVISPLINKPLSPSTLQSTYTGMKSAYQTQIKPQLETETDSEINTKTYQEVMTETLLETVPETSTGTDTEIETKPGTETTPGTGTGSGTGTGTGTDTDADPDENIDVEKYKVDLRQVFPFCIPFDFIALLRVLDAEPEAPRFEIPFIVPSAGINETYVIDLSMFNDAMEVIRLFELVSFVIGLMLLTGKVIKW